MEGSYNKVLYDYDAQRNDELSLKVGDIVHVIKLDSDDWCIAENTETGQQGAVPTNFLEQVNQPPCPKTTSALNDGPVLAKVLQDYAAQEPGELSLWKNGVVTILDQDAADGWWKGDLNGKAGVFPANHVKLIDAHEQVADAGESDASRRQSFKLAAYGVKQGGIGSILAGGFNLRKKGSKKDATGHEDAKSAQSSPSQQQNQQQQREPSQQSVTKANDSTGVKSSAEYEKAMVTSPYDPQNEDELQLVPGAYVTITDKMNDEGWWKGLNEKNEQGVFPSNFVQIISSEGAPVRPLRARPPTIKTDSQTSLPQSSLTSPTGMAKPPPVPVGTRPSSLLTRRPTGNNEQHGAPSPRPITSPPLHSRSTSSSIKDSSNNISNPTQSHKRTPSIPLTSPDLPPIQSDNSHYQHPVRPSRPVPSPGSIGTEPNQIAPASPTSEEKYPGLAKVPKAFGKHQAAPSPPSRTSRPNSQASSINTATDSVSLHALVDDYNADVGDSSPPLMPPPRVPRRTMPSVPSKNSIPEEEENEDSIPPRQHSRESSIGSNNNKNEDVQVSTSTSSSSFLSSSTNMNKAGSLPSSNSNNSGTGLNLVAASMDPLELKLRQWFKEEADHMRQYFESRLEEERSQRLKLEMELKSLKSQLP